MKKVILLLVGVFVLCMTTPAQAFFWIEKSTGENYYYEDYRGGPISSLFPNAMYEFVGDEGSIQFYLHANAYPPTRMY